MCHADARSQRLNLMLRLRFALGRVYQAQGLNLECFYVLRQGLINFKRLAEGQFVGVEQGAEPESKGSFRLPEQPGGGGAAAGKKGAPPAKEAKGKPGQVDEAEAARKAEEELAKKAAAQAESLLARVEALERRQHPYIGLWLSTKVHIISILLAEKRYEDCGDAIAVTRLEAQSVKDHLYVRKLLEMEFTMNVQAGDIREALEVAKKIIAHADKYHQTDESLCDFLGNLSELYYNQSKSEDAVQVVEQGRKITWQRLREYGLEVFPQDINGHGDVLVWENRKRVTEEDLEARLANVPQAAAAGGKQAPAKGGKAAAAKGGAGAPAEEGTDDSTETSSLDFSKPIDYKLQGADFAFNSSKLQANLYLKNLEDLLRFDLRYAQYLTLIQHKHQEAKEVLADTASLVSRCLYLSP